MDRSIIELARERARMAGTTWRQASSGPRIERSQTHPNAARFPSRLHRWLAINGETNLYWACTLLFATGVLLALSGMPGAVGGSCHGQP